MDPVGTFAPQKPPGDNTADQRQQRKRARQSCETCKARKTKYVGLGKYLKAVEYRGKDGGHISFSPVLPPEGSSAMAFYRDVKPLCARYGFDYFGGLHLYPRHLAMINMIYFDRTSETEGVNANKLFVELVHLARRHGYSEYRAHIDYMDLVADQYDFNDGSLRGLNERIKDALDPNGILSPGKQGIWPRRFRGLGGMEVDGVVNGVNAVRL